MAKKNGTGRDRRRVIIAGVAPEIDDGRFPCRRVLGEDVVVEADIYTDGHEAISARLFYRHERERNWRETAMEFLGNDRWRGHFPADRLGQFRYTLAAWLDPFKGWRRDMETRLAAYQDVSVDLAIGARILEAAAARARGRDAATLAKAAGNVLDPDVTVDERIRVIMDDDLDAVIARYPDLERATRYDRELTAAVDPENARFSSWYELFPRSASPEPGRHGTFADVEARLAYIEELGFDTLYLPPIPPIGRERRKGPNNAEAGGPGDV
ncbi:MAG TPA: maltotransferase domain-containing protein, partial [Longimicrobiales bacterium]|nr:maltotransferase domain-containing protein [Longimicrobiales bacterium]